MRNNLRTPQLRNRRFARVRRLTEATIISAGLAAGLFVGYAASTAKPLTPIPATTHPGGASTTNTPSGAATSGSGFVTPSTAPAAAKTTCYSTPSGTTVCY